MPLELTVLLWLSATLFSCITGLLIYLVARKMAEKYRSRLRAYYIEKYRKPVYAYLLSGIETRSFMPHGRKSKQEALEELLQQCAGLLSGDDTARRIEEYAARVFTDPYRKYLRSSKWSLRINTLYRMEKFNMRHIVPDLQRSAVDNRLEPEERALVYKLLARWNGEGLVGMLVEHGQDISEYQCRVILSHMSQPLFVETVKRFDELPVLLQYTLLDVIGVQRRTEFYAELSVLTHHPDTETRIRAIKALSQFDYVPADAQYIRHANAEAWQERMMAAKLFGTIRSRLFTPELLRLLGDEVWFVRSQSAQSLLAYPDGPSVLREAAHSSPDRFVREMALEWLGKGGIARELG